MSATQRSLSDVLEEIESQRVAWLLTGCYKILRCLPRRNYFYRISGGEEEEEEFKTTLLPWVECEQ